MKVKHFNLCYVIALIILCAINVESKRSFGLIRSRPKPNNNLSIRRRQQTPVQYTPSAGSSHTASHANAPKPAAPPAAKPAPAPAAPQGPPPPYSPHPIGWKNPGGAPPPYTPHLNHPPSYQQAVGSGANYPRQAYGVGSGAYGHAMPPSYPGAGGIGHTPYGGGMYNNHYNPGMGMSGGMNPGMAMGGMGMGMHSMGGGLYPQQKSSSLFSGSNIMTGLAMYGAYRGIGSIVGGVMGGGYGRHGGYGYGDSTQHVYVHHLNQPAVVTVNGTPVVVNPGESGTTSTVNAGVQPLNAPNVNIQQWATASPAVVAIANNSTDAPICTENCAEKSESPQMPTDMPMEGLDAYPTIHPSLFTYAGGSDDILYWANSPNKNITVTVESTTKAK